MKIKTVLTLLLFSAIQMVSACPLCKKQQPKITWWLTHGSGPQSNADWIIVALIAALTLLTFIFSLKYLLKPGETNREHIKQSILSN